MLEMRNLLRNAAVATAVLIIAFAASSMSADVLNDWDSAKAPPKPELQEVTLDGPTTALLILDMTKTGACKSRPRCMATLPNIKRLYDAARAANAMLWYSFVGANENPTAADIIDPGFMPRDGEWERQGGPDKFLGSHLDEKLKAKGIKTVIVCGTSFQGVGIGTGSEAAQRGYKVIIPVDCLSAEDVYNEQYAAWHMYKGGPQVVTKNSTLTRSTMVKF
jgi:nicotinamidase-related amidase